MTPPARSPVDDALDRLAGDLRSHADVYTYLDRDKDAAAVREELQRLREERDAAEKYRQGEKRRREAAEAEVRRLTEGLRAYMEDHQGIVGAPDCECRLCETARALLSANPPQGDAAEGSSPPTMPCGHPESSVVSADEGTAYCGECASPPDGGGAK